MPKLTLEEELMEFMGYWNSEKLCNLFKDIFPLIDLFDIDENFDWVEDAVGKENERNVRMIRLCYLISRLADFQTGPFCTTNIRFKNLWKKIEKQAVEKEVER